MIELEDGVCEPPLDLHELDDQAIATLVEDLPSDVDWAPGAPCHRRTARRIIVERYDEWDLFGCVHCGCLHFQPRMTAVSAWPDKAETRREDKDAAERQAELQSVE